MFPDLTPPARLIKTYLDNTISVEYDGGYEQTRERHTRNRREITAEYMMLDTTEKNLLVSHYEGVRKTTPFAYTDVVTSEVYTVRYAEPVEVTADAKHPSRYNIMIKMRTV